MTPFQIHGRARHHAMGLMRLRILTAPDLAVLQAMLDHACPRGALAFSTTYDWLQRVTGLCRQTIADAIRRLDACGLVHRHRSGRVVNGRWRQYPNRYFVAVAASESTAQTDTPGSKDSYCRRCANMRQQRRTQPTMALEGVAPDCPETRPRSVAAQLAALPAVTAGLRAAWAARARRLGLA